MEANPPLCEASPPFLAMLETSSLGRLAKLLGLVLPDMIPVVEIEVFVVIFWIDGSVSSLFEDLVVERERTEIQLRFL